MINLIQISKGVYKIPSDASIISSEEFCGCEYIEEIIIPDSVTTIGNNAFAGCKALKRISLGSGLVSIGQKAFSDTALTEITIPDSVQSIGQGALSVTSLESITLPFIGGSRNSSHKFFGFIFGASGYAAQHKYIPKELKAVTVTGGGYAHEDHRDCNGAFYHAACGKPEIPPYAFYGCQAINKVTLGSKITEIGISAFCGCASIDEIYIPKAVQTIAANAFAYNSPFYGCKKGLKIILEAKSINEYALDSDNSCGKGFGRYFSHVCEEEKAIVKLGVSIQ